VKASIVIALSPAHAERGRALAEQFGIPFIDGTDLESAKTRQVERFVRDQIAPVSVDPVFVFLYLDEGLALANITETSFLSIRVDFYSPTVRYRREKGGGKSQMIAKAVGLSSGQAPSVLDATAGLGGDAFVLASLGCSITMIERVPELRALLSDGFRVAKEWGAANDHSLLDILDLMSLVESDAAIYMQAISDHGKSDVVYLDPMFPVRSKSAQVKKGMRVVHQLVGPDADADSLLELALASATKRVVVKRPRIAPTLASRAPSHALEGKSNRYDIYMCGQ